jgi:hypothetical protein
MMGSIMTETRPVYHADIAGLATERRRAMTYAALNDAGAAEAGLLRLVAEIARLRDLLGARHARRRRALRRAAAVGRLAAVRRGVGGGVVNDRAAYANANAALLPLADKSVHMIATSPPYWGLRSYDTGDNKHAELGAEKVHDCLAWARGR